MCARLAAGLLLLLTLGCQPFRARPAYTADPLLWDRRPIAGRAGTGSALAEPLPPPAPTAEPTPRPGSLVAVLTWAAL